MFNQEKRFSSGGIGIWFADLQNTVSNSNISGTVCQLLNYHPPATGNTTSESDEICNDMIPTQVYIDSIILGCYYTAGMFIISLLIRRLGRGYILGMTFIEVLFIFKT